MGRISQIDLDDDVIRVTLLEEFHPVTAERNTVEILRVVARNKITKVLIDGREATGDPTLIERFLYGKFLANEAHKFVKEHGIVPRFAYVMHVPLRDPGRFGENVAANRGVDMKTFEALEEAIQWLNSA